MLDVRAIQVFIVIGLIYACSVQAQIPPEVRERLLDQGVVAIGKHVYAKAYGVLRGSHESSEALYVTRAMRDMAHHLCKFVLVPGKRLETQLEGVTLVASTVTGKELEVVVRAPVQTPSCKVVLVETALPLSPPSSHSNLQRVEDQQTRLMDSGYTRSKDIVIRIFGGEY